jgi:hypothetical protein
LEAHRLRSFDHGDVDAARKANQVERELAGEVEITAGVEEHWRAVIAKQEAEEARKAEDAGYAADAKQALADEKIFRALLASIQQTAKLRDAWSASVARTAAANERRGNRPFIEDAERRARLQPAIERITRPRIETVWIDANGALCGEEAAGARRVERETGVFSVQTGRDAFMPTRYADALRLFDLQGRPL